MGAQVEKQENIKRYIAGDISLFVHKLPPHGIQRHFVFYHDFCPPARFYWRIIKGPSPPFPWSRGPPSIKGDGKQLEQLERDPDDAVGLDGWPLSPPLI